MTPVDQEFVHEPDKGIWGDCQRAVIASLLDLSIKDVPHFLRDEYEGKGNFWMNIADFCHSHGFVFVTLPAVRFKWSSDLVYHAITGPSPRGNGVYHTVVGCNGRVAHDPHPSREGLAGNIDDWTFDLLVRR